MLISVIIKWKYSLSHRKFQEKFNNKILPYKDENIFIAKVSQSDNLMTFYRKEYLMLKLQYEQNLIYEL